MDEIDRLKLHLKNTEEELNQITYRYHLFRIAFMLSVAVIAILIAG